MCKLEDLISVNNLIGHDGIVQDIDEICKSIRKVNLHPEDYCKRILQIKPDISMYSLLGLLYTIPRTGNEEFWYKNIGNMYSVPTDYIIDKYNYPFGFRLVQYKLIRPAVNRFIIMTTDKQGRLRIVGRRAKNFEPDWYYTIVDNTISVMIGEGSITLKFTDEHMSECVVSINQQGDRNILLGNIDTSFGELILDNFKFI